MFRGGFLLIEPVTPFPMIALIICNCITRDRPKETVHFALIVALLLQRGLNIGNYLIRRQIVGSIDGSIPGIIRIGVVAQGRKPVTGGPVIRSTERENDTRVMVVPPTL